MRSHLLLNSLLVCGVCASVWSCSPTPVKKEAVATPTEAPVAPVAPMPQPAPVVAAPVVIAPAQVVGPKEVFPGVRLDMAARTVSFDATVPIDCHNEKTPVVFLETVACVPDTKEHESLLMTRVRPSHVHAALLMLGLEPGKVGVWNWDGPKLVAEPPTGPRVAVMFSYDAGGQVIQTTPGEWVVNIRDQRTLAAHAAGEGWVFSGSSIVGRGGQEWYHADREGSLIGLACFGSETISWTRMFSPDSGVNEPVWIANSAAVPPYGTAVTVTITPK